MNTNNHSCMIALIVLQGKLHHFIVRGVIAENSRPVGCGKLPAVVFYRSRELRVAPSRELLDASTGTDVVVLIIPPTADTLRTVKSSRSRSNSKVCHDRHSYCSREPRPVGRGKLRHAKRGTHLENYRLSFFIVRGVPTENPARSDEASYQPLVKNLRK